MRVCVCVYVCVCGDDKTQMKIFLMTLQTAHKEIVLLIHINCAV